MGIRLKTLIILVVFSLVPVAVVAALALAQTQGALKASITRSLATMISEKADSLEKIVNHLVLTTRLLALDPVLRQAIASQQHMGGEEERRRIQEIDQRWIANKGKIGEAEAILGNAASKRLLAIQETDPARYGELFLTDAWGATLAMTKILSDYDQSDEFWWSQARDTKNVFIDDRGHDESVDAWVFGVVVPIVDEGQVVGVLKANYRVQDVVEVVTSRKLASQEQMMLLSSLGEMLATTRPHFHGSTLTELERNLLHIEQQTVVEDVHDRQKTIMLAAPVPVQLYRRVQSPGAVKGIRGEKWEPARWILVAEVFQSEAFLPVFRMRHTFFFVGGMVILIAVVIAWWFSNRITRPLGELVAAARRIGQGDLEVAIHAPGGDELSVLAGAFNHMAWELRGLYEDMESRVQRRTAELNQANRDLAASMALHQRSEADLMLFRHLVDQGNDSLYLLDAAKGTLRDTNACRELGFAREELVGQHLGVVEEHFSDPGVWPPFSAGLGNGGRQILEGRHHRRDGTSFPVEITFRHVPMGGQDYVVAVARDISERQQAVHALREAESKYRTLFEMSPDGILLICPDTGKALDFNGTAHEQLGYTADEFRQLTIADYEANESPEQVRAHTEDILAGDGQVQFETRHRTRQGHIRQVLVRTEILSIGGKRLLHAIYRDITEQKKLQQDLMRTMAELKRSNEELERFASIASHDLKEPLRKIHAFGDLLAEEYGSLLAEGDGAVYMARIQSAIARMERLIDDLLSFSRVTTRANPFTRVDLEAVMQEVLSTLETRLHDSGGRVVHDPLPQVEADGTQMLQLFQNLLANALKFHRPGVPPQVTVTALPLEREQVEIRVQDNGIGFDEQYLEKIFQPFQRLHGRDAFEGTGIGLALCQRIVVRHGGTLTAQGQPGEGATFIVRLPRYQAGSKE